MVTTTARTIGEVPKSRIDVVGVVKAAMGRVGRGTTDSSNDVAAALTDVAEPLG